MTAIPNGYNFFYVFDVDKERHEIYINQNVNLDFLEIEYRNVIKHYAKLCESLSKVSISRERDKFKNNKRSQKLEDKYFSLRQKRTDLLIDMQEKGLFVNIIPTSVEYVVPASVISSSQPSKAVKKPTAKKVAK